MAERKKAPHEVIWDLAGTQENVVIAGFTIPKRFARALGARLLGRCDLRKSEHKAGAIEVIKKVREEETSALVIIEFNSAIKSLREESEEEKGET